MLTGASDMYGQCEIKRLAQLEGQRLVEPAVYLRGRLPSNEPVNRRHAPFWAAAGRSLVCVPTTNMNGGRYCVQRSCDMLSQVT